MPLTIAPTESGWGKKVVDRLAIDLRQAFPDMAGFSPRNLMYMRQAPPLRLIF